MSAPVLMTSSPAPRIVGPGTPVTLQMQMSAGEPLTYQWLRDGVPVPGATNATLNPPGMGLASAGEYTVTVRHAVGAVANWQTMTNFTVLNRMSQITQTPPTGPPARFYRAVCCLERGRRDSRKTGIDALRFAFPDPLAKLWGKL